MATPLQQNSIIAVTAWQLYQGQLLLNVNHYQFQDLAQAPDYRVEMNALLADLNAVGSLAERMADACHEDWELTRLTAQPVFPVRLASQELAVNRAGAKPGTAAPSNVAGVITKHTDLATRYGIGSWHQGGLRAVDVENGVIANDLDTDLTNIGIQVNAARDGTNPNVFVAVLWNINTPNRVTEITGTSVRDTSRVMRRRTLRVGV